MSFLTIEQAAARLGVHPTTLRAWVRQGRIPSYRTGDRFVRLEWTEVVSALRQQAVALARRSESAGVCGNNTPSAAVEQVFDALRGGEGPATAKAASR